MTVRMQMRRGTAAQWTSANPILLAGEEGHETDTGKRKIGDGVTTWASLAYNVGAAQPLDSDLTAMAALTTTSYGRALLTLANQAAFTATNAASTTSASGIVELATTGETQTGSDAVRAVTPAGAAATYAPIASLVALPLGLSDLDTTGTKASTTVLHGDGSWMTDKSIWDIDSSVETMSRQEVNSSGVALNSSGRVAFTYFIANKSLLAGHVNLMMGATGAAATPTLARFGLYTVAADGQVDLVASTANNTTVFSTGSAAITAQAITVPYQLVKGTKYALAIIVVTGAALPTFCGQAMGSNNLAFVDPIMMSARAGQSDLPSSITKATFAGGGVNSASRIHAWFTT